MNTNTAASFPEIPARQPWNPVLWLIWILPAAAVIASFATLAIALRDADRALPAIYHWEGERLDSDFARARHAAQLGITAALRLPATGGQCAVVLNPPSAGGDVLELRLTHGVDAGFDRLLRLERVGEGEYRAPCAPPPQGRWRIALQDAAGSWALRANAESPITDLQLHARTPEGPGT